MPILMILLMLIHSNPRSEDEQTFMAMLKRGEGEADAILHNQIVFTVIEGKRFLYDNVNHHAYLSNGQFGYLAPHKIRRADDETVFKFDFSDEAYTLSENNALMILGRQKKIDFKDLITRILQQDPQAFLEYVSQGNNINGSALGIYESMFWKLINDWSDLEVFKMLKTADAHSRKAFIDLMLDVNSTWPVEDPKSYFEKYYPRTFERFISDY